MLNKITVGDATVKLNLWQKGNIKRVYFQASGPRINGKGYDWGYIDSISDVEPKGKDAHSHYRHERDKDPQGFTRMMENARAML